MTLLRTGPLLRNEGLLGLVLLTLPERRDFKLSMEDIECRIERCFFFIGDTPFARAGATRTLFSFLLVVIFFVVVVFAFGGRGGIADKSVREEGAGGAATLPSTAIFST